MSDKCAKCGKALEEFLDGIDAAGSPVKKKRCPDHGDDWRWRKCKFGGKPVPPDIHPCARPCNAHLGFGDHVIPNRCAVCPVPAEIADRDRWQKIAGRLAGALRVASPYHYPDEAKKRDIGTCLCRDCELLRAFEEMEAGR